MAHRRAIDVMLGLLHAQREEVRRRSSFARESPDWLAATQRLDALNDHIMEAAAIDVDRREMVGDGVQLALDCLPFDDGPFRRDVIDAVRQAIEVMETDRLGKRATGRIASFGHRVLAATAVIDRARRTLKSNYPDATLDAAADGPRREREEPFTLRLRAERDPQVA